MVITLTRIEGPISACNKPTHVSSFEQANHVLRLWSNSAPEHGGYDKCDFAINANEFDFVYSGRYDLVHWRKETPNLKAHILDFLGFMSGDETPHHLTKERHLQMLKDHYGQTENDRAHVRAIRSTLSNVA